jgi:hypothetical protein
MCVYFVVFDCCGFVWIALLYLDPCVYTWWSNPNADYGEHITPNTPYRPQWSCTSSEVATHRDRSWRDTEVDGTSCLSMVQRAIKQRRMGDAVHVLWGALLALGRLSSLDPAQRRRSSAGPAGSGPRPWIDDVSTIRPPAPAVWIWTWARTPAPACVPASPMWCVSFLSLVQQPGSGWDLGHATVAWSNGRSQ